MPEHKDLPNVRPVNHGLDRPQAHRAMQSLDRPRVLAETSPEVMTPPNASAAGFGKHHAHQHIRLRIESPQQAVSYRRTTIYYRNGGTLTSSPTALPAGENAISSAIMRGVKLLVWTAAPALAVNCRYGLGVVVRGGKLFFFRQARGLSARNAQPVGGPFHDLCRVGPLPDTGSHDGLLAIDRLATDPTLAFEMSNKAGKTLLRRVGHLFIGIDDDRQRLLAAPARSGASRGVRLIS